MIVPNDDQQQQQLQKQGRVYFSQEEINSQEWVLQVVEEMVKSWYLVILSFDSTEVLCVFVFVCVLVLIWFDIFEYSNSSERERSSKSNSFSFKLS